MDIPFRSLDVKDLSTGEAYRILNNMVSPRPIAFVSTRSERGAPNLAPFSYFMAGGANPPSVVVSPVNTHTGKPKDTLMNIRATGQFTINLLSYSMLSGMNQASYPYPHGDSEWPHAGFTPVPCVKVNCDRVAESLIAIECVLHQIVPHGAGTASANYVIGEVVYFHVAESLYGADGQIDPRKTDYITRMGGDWYSHTTPETMFELGRPESAETAWRNK